MIVLLETVKVRRVQKVCETASVYDTPRINLEEIWTGGEKGVKLGTHEFFNLFRGFIDSW